MSYQPPPNYSPPPSPGRDPASWDVLALALAVFGVTAAWLAMPSGWFTPEIRDYIFRWWQETPVVEGPPPRPGPVAVPSPLDSGQVVTQPPPKRDKADSESPGYVAGIWRSNSRSGITYVIQQNGNLIDIYQDHPTKGQVKIGSGVVGPGGVKATIRTIKENRAADLTLRLSDDGQTLSGTFIGAAPQEFGPVSLSRIRRVATYSESGDGR